jgi:hypothetical protein
LNWNEWLDPDESRHCVPFYNTKTVFACFTSPCTIRSLDNPSKLLNTFAEKVSALSIEFFFQFDDAAQRQIMFKYQHAGTCRSTRISRQCYSRKIFTDMLP